VLRVEGCFGLPSSGWKHAQDNSIPVPHSTKVRCTIQDLTPRCAQSGALAPVSSFSCCTPTTSLQNISAYTPGAIGGIPADGSGPGPVAEGEGESHVVKRSIAFV
jgi:hypothetical protein